MNRFLLVLVLALSGCATAHRPMTADGGQSAPDDASSPALNASPLCATALERNAELGCHGTPSVDVCPVVWDGHEVCNADRSAACLERLTAATTCSELVVNWRSACLVQGVCSPVSP